ncbi:MAG: hypothetical protein ABIH23_17600 [bacterium]
MKHSFYFIFGCLVIFSPTLVVSSESAQGGTTIYVSKLGDNSDGATWKKAYKTIQGALDAVPDGKGNHRIIIRPDTYMEANLDPANKGAAGAYNIIEADFDGSLGSGTTGYAVIDSSDPEKGFKSVDWWSTCRASRDFSSLGWDRWIWRHLYTTGGDAGLGWDMTSDEGAEFTAIVEDCVGIGRAFGTIVGAFMGRPEEPVIYRRSQFWCLDWWGDACGAYVRANHTSMPDYPDVIYEDCTLAGPDNAFQAGNPGYSGYTRVKFNNCRLISFNFSQPRGTPSSGIIYSTIEGKLLHVDLEDCTLMGYKVFGAGEGEISYTTRGSVRAYVQFEQSLPEGFFRLAHWPVDIFQTLLPPQPLNLRPAMEKEPVLLRDMCEVAPFVWQGRLCLMECVRPGSGGALSEYYLKITDVETGKEMARFAEGHGLASIIVHNGALYVFASRFDLKTEWNDVTLFKSTDMKNWEKKVVIREEEKEHLFNSTVCAGPDGFVMAYESNDPTYPAFTTKFARSKDLESWTKIPDAIFGADRYTACPCIRYANGYYYMLYIEHQKPRWFFETFLVRSKDLKEWELSPLNPVLTPEGNDEGINASDPDIIEFNGKTYLYYSVGDQRTWMNTKLSIYPGSLQSFFEEYY